MCDFKASLKQRNALAELTRVQALHPEGQPGLGDGDELQGDVELAASKVTQPSGSAQLCDLNRNNS